MIISNNIHRLFKKTFLLSFIFFISVNAQRQQLQRIGFVDIEYVLENIPSYANAQEQLNSETTLWKSNLDKMYLELDTMEKEFLNEKPLLTEDLIKERETEIEIFKNEITKVENTYFGTEGKLFELRKELVIPYQDVVYNAVQTIAKLRKYDMIFEKSSSIVMLYTNNNYDISELILKYIQKTQKEIEQEEEAVKREQAKLAREKRVQDQRDKRNEYLKKRKEERSQKFGKKTKQETVEETLLNTDSGEKTVEETKKQIVEETQVSTDLVEKTAEGTKEQIAEGSQVNTDSGEEEVYQKTEKEIRREQIAAKRAEAKLAREKRIQDQKDRRTEYLKKLEEERKKREEERKNR